MGSTTFIKSIRNDPDLARMLDDGVLTEPFLVQTHRTYRRTYPAIPRFWRATETAFRNALSHGSGETLGIPFMTSGNAVYIEPPSTRKLIYRKPSITGSSELTYVSKHRRGRDGQVNETPKRLFGGLLTENIVQAISRDVLVDAMLKLEAKGYEVVLHVHDEVVLQVPTRRAKRALAETEKELSTTPDWAEGLPLAAEGHVSDRYGK